MSENTPETPDFSDGCMIALRVPRGTATRVAQPGGLPPEDLHVTLAFLGNVQDLSDEQKAAIIRAATETAASSAPLTGYFPAGHGTFENGDSPDGRPYWLDPGTPGIRPLRATLIGRLREHGVDDLVARNHPFNPHVTVSYLSPDDPAPTDADLPSPTPITWTELVAELGPDTHSFPLASPASSIPPAPTQTPVVAAPFTRSRRVPADDETALRARLALHNAVAPLGRRASLETLRAVYLRAASPSRPLQRVDQFLASLATRAPSQDQDLYPPEPVRSSTGLALDEAAALNARPVQHLLLASALAAPGSPDRALGLSRALALASRDPDPRVRASLPARIRALLAAGGNSSAAKSLRAKRQLRDRYGRWIEMGGGVRFKVRRPGTPGGGEWYHGTVVGQDVPNGKVNVRLPDGRTVAVPHDKLEQPLAILHTDPRDVGNRPQDRNAPAVKDSELNPAERDDSGTPATTDEASSAVDDAGKELARRVGDDSTEANTRDQLLRAAAEANGDPDRLRELADAADNAARANAGRMTPDEAEAFRAYAEDLQDVAAARAPEHPNANQPIARLPDSPQATPDGEPVDTAAPEPAPANGDLPSAEEFANVAGQVERIANRAEPDSLVRDRLAAVNNLVANVGEDLHDGNQHGGQVADLLRQAGVELDNIANEHFDELPEGGEDDLNEAIDGVANLHDRVVAWNEAPDAPSPAPGTESPDAAPPAPGLDYQPRYGADLAPGMVNENGEVVVRNNRSFGRARNEREITVRGRDGNERKIYVPPRGRTIDGWAEQPSPSPDAPSPDAPGPQRSPAPEVDPAEMVNPDSPEGRAHAVAQALDEAGAPGSDELRSVADSGDPAQIEDAIQSAVADLPDDSPVRDLASPAPSPDAPEAAPANPANPEVDRLAAELDGVGGEDLGNIGRDIGEMHRQYQAGEVDAGQLARALDQSADNLAWVPDDQREGRDQALNKAADDLYRVADQIRENNRQRPAGTPPAPAQDGTPETPAPSGETDQFGNAVPAGLSLANEVRTRNETIQIFKPTEDDGSRVDVAVSRGRDGQPRYVVRYRNAARSNHDNWDDALAAMDAERERVAPLHVEDRARADRANQERQARQVEQDAQHQRRVEGNLDEADRPLPEGWTRDRTQDGQVVMRGPGRYTAFSDADGQLHLMHRDAQGNVSLVGSHPDWESLQRGLAQDQSQRARDHRDELGQFLAGHGFSEDTINAARTAPDPADAMRAIAADPAFQRMSNAAEDAGGRDIMDPNQRRAFDEWGALARITREMQPLTEPTPAPATPSPAPEDRGPDALPTPNRGPINLTQDQRSIVEGIVNDLLENDGQSQADAINDALGGDFNALDALPETDRDEIRDEIVGRAQVALAENQIREGEARELVNWADDLIGLPPDPNDGLVEPVRAESPTPDAPEVPAPADVPPAPAAPEPPAAPAAPAAPRGGAPAGQEARYHPQGLIHDRAGNEIRAGVRVRARRDGATGTVVAVQQQPPYARVRLDDGRTVVRAGAQLHVMPDGAAAPAAPGAPAAAPAVNVAPAPDAPALPPVEEIQARVQAVRENIPSQIGRAGHADPNVVNRRNAGFALGDAEGHIQQGQLENAVNDLDRAIRRLAAYPGEQAQVRTLRNQVYAHWRGGDANLPGANPQQFGRPAAPAAPAPAARGARGRAPLVEGAQPADWLDVPAPEGLGEVAPSRDNNTPGVGRPDTIPARSDAPNPGATPDQFAAWGDRAGEVALAAATRPSIDALVQALGGGGNSREAKAIAEAVFNADGSTTFGHKGYTVRVAGVSGNGNQITVSFRVLDADGNSTGATLNRTLTRHSNGRWGVYNAYMQFPARHQKSGFASAWNRNVENWAIANNFNNITVSAGLDKGGGVWALNGFDWNDDSARGAAEVASRMLEGRIARKASTPAEQAQVADLRRRIELARQNNDRSLVPTPMELALVGWQPGKDPNTGTGVKAMFGSGWSGIKRLDPNDRAYQQARNYQNLKAANQRIAAGENVAQVSRGFGNQLANDANLGAALNDAERVELVDALNSKRSLAGLRPATRRKALSWSRDAIPRLAASGDTQGAQDAYQLMRALRAEETLEVPPSPLGVGEALRDVSLRDLQAGRWPAGFDGRALSGNEAGINGGRAGNGPGMFMLTHQASGQKFFVKNDTYGNRASGAGRDAEADFNQLLRGLDGGGWQGVGEFAPSNVEPDMIIMQRLGDNVDMKDRPKDAGKQRGNLDAAFRKLGNIDEPMRMFLLDLAGGNLDRHDMNWQLGQDADGRWRMFPIDHGLAGGGNRWYARNTSFSSRLTNTVNKPVYQRMQRMAQALGPAMFEYLMRQSIADYRASLQGGRTWQDGQFVQNFGAGLDEVERGMAAVLRKMGF